MGVGAGIQVPPGRAKADFEALAQPEAMWASLWLLLVPVRLARKLAAQSELRPVLCAQAAELFRALQVFRERPARLKSALPVV
ncbi:MAG: hypothetical protein QHJ82_01150 [Verrucomicrobiota bacterium]|nr:hypothetical protein [Verrucomicrobiota bacterium]